MTLEKKRKNAESESDEAESDSDLEIAKEEKEVVPSIYKTDKIEKKLDRVKKVTLKILNKFSKKSLKKVPWIEQPVISILFSYNR